MSEGSPPNFDTLNDDQVQEEPDQQDWFARPAKKGNKKKKKKSRQHAEDFFPVEGEEDVRFAPTIAEADTLHQELEGVDLNGNDFPPDRLALERETSPESPSLLVEHVNTTSAVQHVAQPPRPIPESTPRPVAEVSHSTSTTSLRQATSYGSPGSQGYNSRSQKNKPRPNLVSTRKESFPAYATSPHHFAEPTAPPHMPQAHYFGLPDLGLGFGSTNKQTSGHPAGSKGYCCCFDSFADAGDSTSARKAKDALLVGSEGGLEVFCILLNKVEVAGRLEGLRGSVIGAKILPHVLLYDNLQPLRPLVAVIVHGLLAEESSQQRYQTTVEVYSLQTQQHVATLYKTVAVTVEQPTLGHLTMLPEPTEHLSLSAYGKFITIASGKSGEVFVYSHATYSADVDPQFRCIGKFWTALQSSTNDGSSRPASSSGRSQAADAESERQRVPLLSLNQRWLALVPPNAASRVSIQGSPLLPSRNPNPPGLASAVAPPQPPVTCEVAGVGIEDAWTRLTRQAAKGVVRYSQKGIDLGWQGWKELTNPAPQSTQQHGRSSSKEGEQLFPPTKAPPEEFGSTDNEPTIISIIDLEALLEAEETRAKYPPAPLASFEVLDGCNFLAFSSNGLRLLTVSRNGDLSIVWDLCRCCHGCTKPQDDSAERDAIRGPSVEQVHRMPRSSHSVVVDCVWSRDDEHLAMLTKHGTVHLHEIPAYALSRKRKRRSSTTKPVSGKAQATVSVSQASSPPSSNTGFFGSLKSGFQQMTTQVSGVGPKRSTSGYGIPTSFAGFREATTSAGHAGGRVLAKGLSQGLSAAKGGASDYWHAHDNKIRHKELQGASQRSIRWIKLQSDLYFAVVCGGTVHLHSIHRTQKWKGDVLIAGLKHEKHGTKHFALPSIRTRDSLDTTQPPTPSDVLPHGFWSLRHSPGTNNKETVIERPTVPPQMTDIETNPPYCPFHIDSRVDIFTFDTSTEEEPSGRSKHQSPNILHLGRGSKKELPWLFGEPLPASTKVNTHDDLDYVPREYDDLYSDADLDLPGQVESVLTVRTAGDDGEEDIRIDTHRTPRKFDGDEDMGFESVEDEGDDGM